MGKTLTWYYTIFMTLVGISKVKLLIAFARINKKKEEKIDLDTKLGWEEKNENEKGREDKGRVREGNCLSGEINEYLNSWPDFWDPIFIGCPKTSSAVGSSSDCKDPTFRCGYYYFAEKSSLQTYELLGFPMQS